jgi:hypothetical protein
MFWGIIAPRATCFMLVSCLAYSSTLKIEATCSFETSVDFQWTTQHYIQEASVIVFALLRISNLT